MLKIARERLEEFLFPAKSDIWITTLRVGLGVIVTLYALSLWRDWNYLFSADSDALIRRDLAEAMLDLESSLIPRLGWLITLLERVHCSEIATLTLLRACLLGSGLLMVLGFFCRSAAVIAWLLHLATRGSGGFTSYGVDNFMTIGLFYLMLCPLPDRRSLDAYLWKGPVQNPHRIGFHQRVLQLHLCFIYFFGGLAKCLGTGWWNGASMWRALTRSPFNIISPEVLVRGSYFFPLVGICTCLLELGYPLLIWPKKTRVFCLSCILVMHTGIGLAMGLHLFALIMIVFNLAGFGANLWPRPGNGIVSASRSSAPP